MILADTLRDRIDDVIADMEAQFGGIIPNLAGVVEDVLAGKPGAYRELQGVGRDLIAPLLEAYGLAAAALAAEWYDLNRDLMRVGGAWPGAYIQDPQTNTGPLVGGAVKDFTSVEAIIDGIQAGMGQRVHQAAQGTVMDSVLRDPRAVGWGRVASVGCCAFCAMLAGRGAVYRTEHTATFSPHFNCRCQAFPLWTGDTPEGSPMRSRQDTIATRRALTDDQRASQNAQAADWIASNAKRLGVVS